MPRPPKLDHTVINVHYQMEPAENIFRNLGFHLTERGHHSLGSINHLMMFGTDYLELVGMPTETKDRGPGRPEITNAPIGINGLVFKTNDVDETYAHLQQLGMAGDPPKSFSRPVDLPGGARDACFRTVTVRGDVLPGGRVYFCEHGTPDLVWRTEYQRHDNGAMSMPEFVIASENHEREAEDFAKLLYSDVEGEGEQLCVKVDGAKITLLSPSAYQTRYDDPVSPLGSRSSIFGAIVIQTTNLDTIRRLAEDAGLLIIDGHDQLALREPSLDCVLEFIC